MTEDVASPRRRRAALLGLAIAGLLVVCLLMMLATEFLLLVVALVGTGVAGWGGWWAATERMPRRGIGITGIAAGLAVVGWALVSAAADDWWQAALRMTLVILLLAGFSAAARVALVPEERSDEIKRRRLVPERPVLICNLRSGSGKVDQFGLVDLARGLGVEVIVLEPGADLEGLARDAVARGADCLGMAGGDGSQALVAAVAVEHDLPFVCVSAGTRNHFALDLGLDREDPRKSLAAFTAGIERRVDYATVGGRLFVNNVSLGVYAEVVQDSGYRAAKLGTAQQRIPELLDSRAEPFDLQFTAPDGRRIDGAFLVLVSNNPYVMGPAADVGQRRSLTTGALGVFAVTARTGIEAARLISRSAIGLAGRDPNVHQFSSQRFTVTSRSGCVPAGVDGEALELPTPLEFAIVPQGLRVLVPPETLHTAAVRSARGFDLADLWAVARGRAVADRS